MVQSVWESQIPLKHLAQTLSLFHTHTHTHTGVFPGCHGSITNYSGCLCGANTRGLDRGQQKTLKCNRWFSHLHFLSWRHLKLCWTKKGNWTFLFTQVFLGLCTHLNDVCGSMCYGGCLCLLRIKPSSPVKRKKHHTSWATGIEKSHLVYLVLEIISIYNSTLRAHAVPALYFGNVHVQNSTFLTQTQFGIWKTVQ